MGTNTEKSVDRSPETERAKSESPRIYELKDEKDEAATEETHSGLTPIRAPISDDVDEEAEVEGEGVGEHDGDDESVGSRGSFDSALERMAASSTASFEPTSPVGSALGRSQFDDVGLQGLGRGRKVDERKEEGDDNGDQEGDEDEGDGSNLASTARSEDGAEKTEEPRMMPVAKLTTEDDEQADDEIEDDDGT